MMMRRKIKTQEERRRTRRRRRTMYGRSGGRAERGRGVGFWFRANEQQKERREGHTRAHYHRQTTTTYPR
jgi:hypothetical protein